MESVITLLISRKTIFILRVCQDGNACEIDHQWCSYALLGRQTWQHKKGARSRDGKLYFEA